MILETWGSSNAKRKCKMGELTGASCLLKRCAQCCRLKTSRQLCQVPTMKWQAKFQEWHLQMASAGPDQEGHDTLKECWLGDHWRSFCSKCHYHRCAGQACWIGRSSEGISCCFWEKKMNENILRLAFAFLLLWEVLQFGKELLCFWKCFALRLTRGLNTKGLLRWIQKKSAVLTCFLAASFQSNAFAWPYEDFCCYFVGVYVNIQIWTFQLSTNL